MKVREVIRRRFAERAGRGSIAGVVNAVVSANVNEAGRTSTKVSSRQRIVQRGGRTVVAEEETSEDAR